MLGDRGFFKKDDVGRQLIGDIQRSGRTSAECNVPREQDHVNWLRARLRCGALKKELIPSSARAVSFKRFRRRRPQAPNWRKW